MDKRPWVTLFSQTGAEIADIAESLGRWPDLIITNKRPNHLRTIDSRIVEYGYTELPNIPTLEDIENVLEDNAIITLHGWLRIMPPDICEKYLIYNGHPGLITKYPELKGITYGSDGLWSKESQKLHELIDVDIDKIDISLVLNNIQKFRWFTNGQTPVGNIV